MPTMSQGGTSRVQGDATITSPWTTNSNSGENSTAILALPAPVRPSVIVDVEGGSVKKDGRGSRERQMRHAWMKGERRKKMRCLTSDLHALLPHLPAETEQVDILEGAANYIKHLEGVLQKLELQKLERMRTQLAQPAMGDLPAPATGEPVMADVVPSWNAQVAEAAVVAPMVMAAPCGQPDFQTWTAPNVVMNVTGNNAYFNVCAPRQRRILTRVLFVLEKYQIEVVSMTVSSEESRTLFMIHARANGALDRLSYQVVFDEMCKAAAPEMMTWLFN